VRIESGSVIWIRGGEGGHPHPDGITHPLEHGVSIVVSELPEVHCSHDDIPFGPADIGVTSKRHARRSWAGEVGRDGEHPSTPPQGD
jgi:hypothetical protein